jgi:hypothetical protein
VSRKRDEKDLEQLRALVVDLAKDGHTEQAEKAVRLHDALKAEQEKDTK